MVQSPWMIVKRTRLGICSLFPSVQLLEYTIPPSTPPPFPPGDAIVSKNLQLYVWKKLHLAYFICMIVLGVLCCFEVQNLRLRNYEYEVCCLSWSGTICPGTKYVVGRTPTFFFFHVGGNGVSVCVVDGWCCHHHQWRPPTKWNLLNRQSSFPWIG